MPQFVHLSVHSEYSLSDSTVRIPDLVKAARGLGQVAVCIADRSNLFGAVRFYKKALMEGLKPIIAAELMVAGGERRPGHMTLICQNEVGYRNLCQLLTDGYTGGRTGDVPVISEVALRDHAEGLMALSGGLRGHLGRDLTRGQVDLVAARELASWYQEVFRGHFFIELQRLGEVDEDRYIANATALAAELNIPVVATNPVRFIEDSGRETHDVRVAIAKGMTLDQLRSAGLQSNPEQYLKSSKEMCQLFKDIPSAIENTLAIASACTVELNLGENHLPRFPVPEGVAEAEFLEREARRGLAERLDGLYGRGTAHLAHNNRRYEDRLSYELQVINSMGFPGYFLIVSDFIRWSKSKGIPVGPGRGSGAGSLVAYALQITDLDPLEYGLLFERFLNPERVSMPDFDVDFCMDRRDEVIAYVARRYGREAVSQIVTFGTLAAKMVVRDVARVLGHPYAVGDRISKLIPGKPGIKLREAMESNLEFESLYENDLEARAVIDHSLALEGLTRQVGKHAGGVLIAPTKIANFTPTYADKDGSAVVSQYDKDDVEEAGLVKFDFLGLRTLTIIQRTVSTINSRRIFQADPPLDILSISLSDEKTYRLLNKAETNAVFQLESQGMRNLLHQLRPDSFEEIIALVALYRPGPLQAGMVDDFVNRKHGRAEVSYLHPWLEPILSATYGVFVYQEQVMEAAQVLAGYTLGQADLLRRAMGKKKPEEMSRQRRFFCEGAVTKGVGEDTASAIFDLMEKFAGYGFNKSHSAAYGLIAYQTAWLKAHYPAEFMASVLSSDMDKTDKVVRFIAECRRMGLDVRPPNLNHSSIEFVADETGKILYGLEAIKGLGDAAVRRIVEERSANGPFLGVVDFAKRINPTKAVMLAAIKSGLFDEFGDERAMLAANIGDIRQIAKQARDAENHPTADLFAGHLDAAPLPPLQQVQSWSDRERLVGERETLGLYLTGHPAHKYEPETAGLVSGPIADLVAPLTECEGVTEAGEAAASERVVTIVGVIIEAMVRTGRRGHSAFLVVDDGTSQIEVKVFNRTYHQCMHYLRQDEVLVIRGKLMRDRKTDEQALIALEVTPMELYREQKLSHITLSTTLEDWETSQAVPIQKIIDSAEAGNAGVQVVFSDTGKVMPIGEARVNLPDSLLEALRDIVGRDSVALVYDSAFGAGERPSKNAVKHLVSPLDLRRYHPGHRSAEDARGRQEEWRSCADMVRELMG